MKLNLTSCSSFTYVKKQILDEQIHVLIHPGMLDQGGGRGSWLSMNRIQFTDRQADTPRNTRLSEPCKHRKECSGSSERIGRVLPLPRYSELHGFLYLWAQVRWFFIYFNFGKEYTQHNIYHLKHFSVYSSVVLSTFTLSLNLQNSFQG